MESFENFRSKFSVFYEAVKRCHETSSTPNRGGHGIDHDITVSMLAVKIAPTEHIGEMAWCAGMLHSIDRLVSQDEVVETTITLSCHLNLFFSGSEVDEIVQAALRHGEVNQPDQSLVQVVLMDADRLANMQAAVIIRAGQFRPHMKAFEFEHLCGRTNPLSEYSDPKSVLDNLRLLSIRYVPQFRTQEAKRMGDLYATRLSEYIQAVEDDYRNLGLTGITP